ncbi:MAG: TonB-dependent receptor plug domain-containing protein, partial [Duncaniella sp.]|nr:TonB-dependent receptor plug domain-containing protein [Duncaniella sp.]
MRHILPQLLLLLIACAPSLRAESLQSDSLAVSPPPTTRTVSGMVVDDTGESVIGATITAKGKPKIAAVSDVEGRFNLSGLRDGDVLQVSYLGFKTIDIPLKRDRNFYKIMLHGNVSQLDEVVVVGYATQKKADLTGAVSSVNINALEDRPLTNATNALAGLAAGLTVSNSGGNTPGYEAQSILVRGQGTLNNAAPLVVVDGMTGIALSDINPGDIENISILKDAASSAIYGSRAANGVILVTTRQGSEQAPRVTY